MREDRSPRLSDAQRAVARELGFSSWGSLVTHATSRSGDQGGGERSDVLAVTDLSYMSGQAVRIRVRRREHRYDIDDMGQAVAIAGRPPGWQAVAQNAVQALAWNINREGVVLMHAVEGRDIDALVRRTAEASVAVLDAMLELQAEYR